DENLRALTAQITIAHHLPGRIRLKQLATAKTAPTGFSADTLIAALNAIPGVTGVSLNRLARSMTITYDHDAIPSQTWPDLLSGNRTPETCALAARLTTLLARK
ncbi:MAG: cation transporter, partial [Zoogloeaceae bacterium]|nr:cation transporter [Zoogloeaceae bacterium]